MDVFVLKKNEMFLLFVLKKKLYLHIAFWNHFGLFFQAMNTR